MRRQHTLSALLALSACAESKNDNFRKMASNDSIKPYADMGTSPYFMPTKSQRVKNKLNRKRYGR